MQFEKEKKENGNKLVKGTMIQMSVREAASTEVATRASQEVKTTRPT